ncbi:hypothetical protein [Nocardiopsis halotolerans]|uniref:hypothetical protein n=1 Tax=Nocardiopsis halotolerans TaxID=124252 RepID=UPI00034A4708|nr:hypothetical protein [Nocardiopsis halotolerans]
MTSITETTGLHAGFAMPSRQLSLLTAVRGTVLGGQKDVFAVFGESIVACAGNGGTTNGGSVFRGSRSPLMVSEGQEALTGDGSGVPAEPELALDRGKHVAKHAEPTQRLYGASGECPRRIPA